ncbi:MAG: exodeoxyribonuclease VII small subunit [Clostridia bacterium]|nr:exodeoxyribonuclease VII small subunit [Clostridia bacterium]
MPKKEVSFEEALERLEEIVELLESGENPLEKSLDLFEEGVSLVKLCNKKLESVENSIKVLVNNSGELEERDFKPDEQ